MVFFRHHLLFSCGYSSFPNSRLLSCKYDVEDIHEICTLYYSTVSTNSKYPDVHGSK